MTNLPHNEKGFSTIILTVVILIAVTLLTIGSAQFIVTKYRRVNNHFRSQQAFEVAQAGLDYAITYMNENYASLTDGQQITGSTSNSGTYTVTVNFIGGSKDLVDLVSVGNSVDGSASRTISQKVKYISAGTSGAPTLPVIGGGSLDMDSNSRIYNNYGTQTTILGGTAGLSSNARTYNDGGLSSSQGNIDTDITEADATLASMTAIQLQNQYLGASITNLASSATVTYTYSSDHDYSGQLDGLQGVSISLVQTNGVATISSNTEVGTSANPVNIYVEGDIEISSNVEIYGNIIATGKVTLDSNVVVEGLVFSSGSQGVEINSNARIYGALISRGLIELDSNSRIYYDPDILDETFNFSTGSGSYGKVPGSWKDFI